MAVGVTGASGFLGAWLVSALRARGERVIAYARDPARAPAASEVRRYELGTVPDLAGVDTLVHCASAARRTASDDVVALNVEGTRALHDAVRARGGAFVFISSVSAEPGVTSEYGRQKLAIENLLGDEALVLRPALIAGDGGLFARMRALASRPFVPLIGGGRQPVQLVGVRDVYGALDVALRAGLRGRHDVVAQPALTLRELLVRLSPRSGGPRFIDVPFGLALAGATLAERLGMTLPVTAESVRGLRAARVRMPSERLRALGWNPEDSVTVLRALAPR